MPESFAQGLIIPFRKRGDSPDPMNYRPITLLQSSYKMFAKIIVTRVKEGLAGIIGATQQGSVRARLLEKSVVLMQAMLKLAYEDITQGIDDSPGILLLDFMKAYDMLNRPFMLLLLF